MSANFEELDFRPTPIGVLSLRRRRRPSSDIDVYEIKLGDEFLMSSLFTVAEIELARLGLAALAAPQLSGNTAPILTVLSCATADPARAAESTTATTSARTCFNLMVIVSENVSIQIGFEPGLSRDTRSRCGSAVLLFIER